jgi:hypothetical protein
MCVVVVVAQIITYVVGVVTKLLLSRGATFSLTICQIGAPLAGRCDAGRLTFGTRRSALCTVFAGSSICGNGSPGGDGSSGTTWRGATLQKIVDSRIAAGRTSRHGASRTSRTLAGHIEE